MKLDKSLAAFCPACGEANNPLVARCWSCDASMDGAETGTPYDRATAELRSRLEALGLPIQSALVDAVPEAPDAELIHTRRQRDEAQAQARNLTRRIESALCAIQ